MDSQLTRPAAWCASTTWTHRVVRLPWLPRVVRVWLPVRWQSRLCVTEAPAHICHCGGWSIHWGYFPAYEEVAGGEE